MSKQVDFYLIENQVTDAKYKLASRLANKLLKLKKKTLIVTDSADAFKQIDHWLWSFSGTSFVAHDVISSNSESSLIHTGDSSSLDQDGLEMNYDVMINLSNEAPVCRHHFSRIAEIIETSEEQKKAGRLRFKAYQSEGFEIKTHSLEL